MVCEWTKNKQRNKNKMEQEFFFNWDQINILSHKQ